YTQFDKFLRILLLLHLFFFSPFVNTSYFSVNKIYKFLLAIVISSIEVSWVLRTCHHQW
ncbi:unnamed protein product, partial [Arabidopsis halleri]